MVLYYQEYINEKQSSAIPYFGSKYRLMDSLKKHLPKKINTLYDLFTGSVTFSINVKAKKKVANDIDKDLINLYNLIKVLHNDELVDRVLKIVEDYSLDTVNKESYKKLIVSFNQDKDPIKFYVLVMTSFRNMISKNQKGDFTQTYSLKPFNKKFRIPKLLSFKKDIQKIKFTNKDFQKVSKAYRKDDFVYVDPPYLITKASYNKGWTVGSENKLYSYLDMLNSNGVKFMLSNVIGHSGLINNSLVDWSSKYKIIDLNFKYNLNLRKDVLRQYETKEVLIVNY